MFEPRVAVVSDHACEKWLIAAQIFQSRDALDGQRISARAANCRQDKPQAGNPNESGAGGRNDCVEPDEKTPAIHDTTNYGIRVSSVQTTLARRPAMSASQIPAAHRRSMHFVCRRCRTSLLTESCWGRMPFSAVV
jgi:hypothetical protein